MGAFTSWLKEALPPPSKFSVEDIPDLSGKVIIVTGANTGIGKETAKVLLTHNAKVYIACRNRIAAERAIIDLKNETGKEALFVQLDLADLTSVKKAAEEFLSKETQLHVLFNNGGVMMPPVDLLTKDGYDLQFGTNVLGHFYFTKLLLPLLISTAKSSSDGEVRVITTASCAHLFGNLDFNTFKDGPARRRLSSNTLYAQSKFGNIVFALELAKRYGDQKIVSISLNPGNINSDLQRYIPQPFREIAHMFSYSVYKGALTQLYAGTMLEGANLNGKYLIPWAREGPPRVETQDPNTGKALWDWLDEQVKDV